MPDTYKTFLSPGSCKLEITDLVAAANDDSGVDLYGVAWEIEQVLIAGEGFAASPTDVWVNERGILNIGQSLFDKINRTANDNDNIPGQCTVIVKANSLVDSSKVARLKVLVGYPGEGGGGGGGGEHSITCKIVDMQAGTLTDMPSRVSVAVFDEESHEWIQDDDPEYVDEASSGTIMYAAQYSDISVGTYLPRFMGTVDPESVPLGAAQVLSSLGETPIITFPMANTDILVLYVEDSNS